MTGPPRPCQIYVVLLLVGPSTDRPGGVATWFRLVTAALARRGDDGWAHFETDKPHGGHGSLATRLADGGQVAKRLRTALVEAPPDIVHIACGSGWSFREAAVHAVLARQVGARVVLHLHAASLERWWRRGAAERPVIRRVLGSADAVAVLSPGIRDWLVARGVPSARLHVVPNGVPVPAERHPPPNPPPIRLLVVGSVDPRKGVLDLMSALEAIEPIRRAELQIRWVGPGDKRLDGWRRRGAPLGVVFSGPASPEEVQAALAHVHGLLLPSRREGLPFALLEAMSVGVPVLSTDTGAIGELLEDGAGVLVPPGRPAALTRALEAWLENPSALEAIGAAGRRRVLERHRLDDTMAALDGLWARLGREPGS